MNIFSVLARLSPAERACNADDLQFVRTRPGNHMQHIGGNGIIEQMVAKSDPYIPCRPVKNPPFDTHYSGKDNVADTHEGHCRLYNF